MQKNSHQNIILTIDVEDWFQVENFKPWIPFSTWDQQELRVARNTHALLDLLDLNQSVNSLRAQAGHQVKATFFVLGWLAERLPELVREIHSRGHEVASHGYGHKLLTQMNASEIEYDLKISKDCLEEIIGAPVYGYRAPNFSIGEDTLKRVEACGYLYDSSYNSFGMNARYGKLDLSGYPRTENAYRISENFYEIPLSNLEFHRLNMVLPWAGGGYFRLIPSLFFLAGVNTILRKNGSYVFYLHPWEIDPNQPKVQSASWRFRFRHYLNIHKTISKLTAIIERFGAPSFTPCAAALGLWEA